MRLGPMAGALAVAATLGAAVVMAATIEPGRTWAAVPMIVATLWGTAPLVALLATEGSSDRWVWGGLEPVDADQSPGEATVTTVIRVGDEPDEIAAAATEMACQLGPVALVGRRPAISLPAGVIDVCDTPVGEALATVARGASTPAVLIISGRAAVSPHGVHRAVAHLRWGCDWVWGRTRSFNDDRFVPGQRDRVGDRLRRRALEAGLTLWEPDATLVRTSLLLQGAPRHGRPIGRWLRGGAHEGATGVVTDEQLTVRAAPVSAEHHWPDALARQRAAAADLADALFSTGPGAGGWRGRLVAAALLLRELYAVPLVVWMAAPVVLASGPVFGVDLAVGVGVLFTLGVARWAALRVAVGVPLTPRGDLLAAVNGIPGSLASAVSAVARRAGASRPWVPARPNVWAAMAATLFAGAGLIQVTPGTPGSRTVAAICIGLLVGLWVLTVRSLVQRTWQRNSFRLAVSMDATVEGRSARVVDAAPGGIALVTQHLDTARNGELTVELPGTDQSPPLRLAGTVAYRRTLDTGQMAGIQLHMSDADQQRWLQRLAATASSPEPTSPNSHTAALASRTGRGAENPSSMVDRLIVGAVTAVSLVVVAALLLVLLGYRPLVVRSGSMVPTIGIGDVVLTDRVPASEIGEDDIVTLDHYPPIGESMTHRVVAIEQVGDTLQITTQGDANAVSETWGVSADQLLGRVVATLPSIGTPAVMVRTSPATGAVAVVSVAAVVALIVRVRRRPSA